VRPAFHHSLLHRNTSLRRARPDASNDPASLIGYATRNAANMLIVVLLDTMICGLLLFFLAGFRRLIRDGQPSSMWLAT